MKQKLFSISFASQDEARRLIETHVQYYHNMSQMNIEWRARQTGATLPELIAKAQSNVLDFTAAECQLISECIDDIHQRIILRGFRLPLPSEIVFVKSNMHDEGEAVAYTTGNQIFLSSTLLYNLTHINQEDDNEEAAFEYLVVLLTHELFHCITRNSPSFRQKMYSLIGFTILDHDIQFPQPTRDIIMSNPDVEHIDSYAEFTINGIKRKCVLASVFNSSWAKASARRGNHIRFFNYADEALIPLDNLSTTISIDEATDFWDKLGQNTHYVSAPEECLADNFSYAVVYGIDADDDKGYKSPKLIWEMTDVLKQL